MGIDAQLHQKLVHPLAEIRGRALDTLLFKFKNGLLLPGDLAREKLVLKCLLDLLHDSDANICGKKKDILILLDSISELRSAQDRLIEMGGLRTLKQVEVDPGIQEKILKKLYLVGNVNRTRPVSPSRASSLPRPSPIRQTPSPTRRQLPVSADKTDSFPHYGPPPCIPTALRGYDYVHLSPVDQETVDSLIQSLSSSQMRTELEEKLFDVICIDFGAQLILEGLASSHEDRFLQSLSYLKKLLEGLSISFRQHCDIPISTGSFSPEAITPNVSLNIPLSALNQASAPETGLGLPAAAHIIFIQLTDILRFDAYFPRIISLLQDILPFLLLYLQELILVTGDSEDRIEEYMLHYVTKLSLAGQRSQLVSEDIVLVYYEIQAWFALDMLHSMARLISDDCRASLLAKALDVWASQSQICDAIDFIATQYLQANNLGIVQFLSPLVHHHKHWGLQLISSCLEYGTRSSFFEATKGILSQICKCDISILDKGLRQSVIVTADALSKSKREYLDFCNIIKQICWINDGENKPCEFLNEQNIVMFWLRGLLHRDEEYRRLAVTEVIKLLELDLTNYPDEPYNVFVFSSSILNSIKYEDSLPSISSLDLGHSWDKIIETVQKAEILNSSTLADIWDKIRVIRKNDFIRTCMANNSSYPSVILFGHLGEKEKFAYINHFIPTLKATFAHWTCSSEHISHSNYAFKIVRFLAENQRCFRPSLTTDLAFVKCMVKVALQTTPSNRFECARIIAATTLLSLEQDKQFLIGSSSLNPDLMCVPNLVFDSFFVYGAVNKSTVDGSFLILPKSELLHIWTFVSSYLEEHITKRESKTRGFMVRSLTSMSSAKSHADFILSLSMLDDCIHSFIAGHVFNALEFQSALERFFLVMPVSIDDQVLLAKILHFLKNAMRTSGGHRKKIIALCIKGLDKVLLPSLQKSILTEDADSRNFAFGSLSAEIMSFLRQCLGSFTHDELQQVASSTACLPVIKEYTHHTFASEYGSAKNHRERINCLACLLSFASLPSLVSAVRVEIIVDMIHLLVQILGYSQHNYINATHGNAFTYKDRNVYRWVATCLRNLSRTVVVEGRSHIPWTDNWLFNGCLDWLLILLNDDDKGIQKLGLGILGNLILIQGSYPHICLKIPQFLDMAFSFFLDFDHHQSRRAEAIQIINNFIAPFSQSDSDNAIRDLEFSFLEQSNIDQKSEVIKICENSGLFDRFRDLLDCPPHNTSYKLALLELVLNLILISPDIVFDKLLDFESIQILITWISVTPEPITSFQNVTNPLYNRFRHAQFVALYSEQLLSCSANAIHLLRILMRKSQGFVDLAIRSSLLIPRLQQLFEDIYRYVTRSENLANRSSDFYWNNFKQTCLLFGDIFHHMTLMVPQELLTMFHHQQTGQILMKIVCLALNKRDDFETCRAASYLVARILATHYGEVLDLNLEHAFLMPYSISAQHNYQALPENERTIIVILTESLIRMLLEEFDPNDAVVMESVRISLQCLLGRNEQAKAYAISIHLESQLIEKAEAILRVSLKKLEDAKQSDLFIIMSLLRHLMAGSRDAKILCGQYGLGKIVLDIIAIKDVLPPLLMETLECLRNFVANCDETKKKILETRRNTDGITILDILVSYIVDLKTADDTFFATLEVMKLLVLHAESRAQLMKMNIAGQLADTFPKLIRLRSQSRVDGILQLLHHLTFFAEGQLHVIRVQGFLSMIAEFLAGKSLNTRRLTAMLLRNLAILRENKARFLALDDFFGLLESSLQCKSLKVLAPICSMAFVLLYDSEKAKATAKQTSFKGAISSLETRLRQDYVHFLAPSSFNESTSQDIDREDEELLKQALRDLSVMNKLLR